MKVICPICRKVFNKHENLLIHLHNKHVHLSNDKIISIVCRAKQYGFRMVSLRLLQKRNNVGF